MISREDIIRMATTKEKQEFWEIDDENESDDEQFGMDRTESVRQKSKYVSTILLDVFLSVLRKR